MFDQALTSKMGIGPVSRDKTGITSDLPLTRSDFGLDFWMIPGSSKIRACASLNVSTMVMESLKWVIGRKLFISIKEY